MICEARYEPGDTSKGTHTCLREAGHSGRHLCPICHASWDEPGSHVIPLLFISPQVAERVEQLLGRQLQPADMFHVTRQGNKNAAAAFD